MVNGTTTTRELPISTADAFKRGQENAKNFANLITKTSERNKPEGGLKGLIKRILPGRKGLEQIVDIKILDTDDEVTKSAKRMELIEKGTIPGLEPSPITPTTPKFNSEGKMVSENPDNILPFDNTPLPNTPPETSTNVAKAEYLPITDDTQTEIPPASTSEAVLPFDVSQFPTETAQQLTNENESPINSTTEAPDSHSTGAVRENPNAISDTGTSTDENQPPSPESENMKKVKEQIAKNTQDRSDLLESNRQLIDQIQALSQDEQRAIAITLDKEQRQLLIEALTEEKGFNTYDAIVEAELRKNEGINEDTKTKIKNELSKYKLKNSAQMVLLISLVIAQTLAQETTKSETNPS